MNNLAAAIINLVKVDSFGAIVIRAIIWLVLVSIVAYGVAKGKKDTQIRTEAAYFIAFIVISGIAIYLVYGIIPTLTTSPTK